MIYRVCTFFRPQAFWTTIATCATHGAISTNATIVRRHETGPSVLKEEKKASQKEACPGDMSSCFILSVHHSMTISHRLVRNSPIFQYVLSLTFLSDGVAGGPWSLSHVNTFISLLAWFPLCIFLCVRGLPIKVRLVVPFNRTEARNSSPPPHPPCPHSLYVFHRIDNS